MTRERGFNNRPIKVGHLYSDYTKEQIEKTVSAPDFDAKMAKAEERMKAGLVTLAEKADAEIAAIHNVTHFTVVDTYTKEGRHLKSVATASNGDVLWEEGPIPFKDCSFFVPPSKWPWEAR